MKSSKKILVAVAWPYVNGDLHIGHLAGYLLPADITARLQRLIGHDVLMISGSDCHGTPITLEAEQHKVPPTTIVAKYHSRDINLFKKFNLSFNLYTKTTTKIHEQVVQQTFLELLKAGYILKKTEPQYYSKEDNSFLPDRYVEGECPLCHAHEQRSDQCEVCGRMIKQGTIIKPYSKMSGHSVSMKMTEHYYLDLVKLQIKLKSYVKKHQNEWRHWVYQEAKGWLKEGLQPRAITRDLDWGVKIPHAQIPYDKLLNNTDHKRFYVWFEAVIGYLSASQEWSKLARNKIAIPNNVIFQKYSQQETNWEAWWKKKDAQHYYFLGQDNVVFHALMWPGQLFGLNKYNLPDKIVGSKFLNYNEGKFSKSRGRVISFDELAVFGVDVARLALIRILPENKTTSFSWEGFIDIVNNELVANLGNFIHRTLTFFQNNFSGEIELNSNKPCSNILNEVNKTFEQVTDNILNQQIVEAFKKVLKLSSFGNKYFNDSKIWEKMKQNDPSCQFTMINLLCLVEALTLLIAPFAPNTSNNLHQLLGHKKLKPLINKNLYKFVLPKKIILTTIVQPIFQKIDKKEVLEKKQITIVKL